MRRCCVSSQNLTIERLNLTEHTCSQSVTGVGARIEATGQTNLTGEGHTPGFANGLNDHKVDPAEVRKALDRVFESQGFRASRRSQDFLRYVVERTLDGQSESLKSASGSFIITRPMAKTKRFGSSFRRALMCRSSFARNDPRFQWNPTPSLSTLLAKRLPRGSGRYFC